MYFLLVKRNNRIIVKQTGACRIITASLSKQGNFRFINTIFIICYIYGVLCCKYDAISFR